MAVSRRADYGVRMRSPQGAHTTATVLNGLLSARARWGQTPGWGRMHTTLPGRSGRGQDCGDHTHPKGDDMVLTAGYPVLDVLWTTIIFLCWIAWIWLLILSFIDLFGRVASGWAEGAWVASVIVLPVLGCVRSIVTRSDGRAASEIERAKQLLDSGATTRQEFDQLKTRALAWSPSMTEIGGTA